MCIRDRSNTLQFSEDMEKPHILVIATGGTIASKESELGLTPAMSGEELVSDIPGIRNVCTPVSYTHLINRCA